MTAAKRSKGDKASKSKDKKASKKTQAKTKAEAKKAATKTKALTSKSLKDLKDPSIALLQRLTEAHGAPGHEAGVRDIVRDELGTNFQSDKLGSLVYEQVGAEGGPRVMITGHMDEVGFMVHSITPEGLLRFAPLGGWWGHSLMAHRVRIMTLAGHEVLGVITSKPPHFLSPEERKKVLSLDKMYIDVGATCAEQVTNEFGINQGDTVVPDSNFTRMHNPDFLLCKAFDNRVGVGLTIQAAQTLAKLGHPNTILATATVQEEVGTRGAQTATAVAKPDVALVMEGTPGDDLPGGAKDERQAVLGGGVQVRLMDPTAIAHRRLIQVVREASEQENIPVQWAVRRSGGTDAKVIHLHDAGIPTVVFGVPARYIHTHNSIIHIQDYLTALQLTVAVAQRLDRSTVDSLTDYTQG